jgi:hypothetical protein
MQFQIQAHKVPQIAKKKSENINTVLENTVPLCKAYPTEIICSNSKTGEKEPFKKKNYFIYVRYSSSQSLISQF